MFNLSPTHTRSPQTASVRAASQLVTSSCVAQPSTAPLFGQTASPKAKKKGLLRLGLVAFLLGAAALLVASRSEKQTTAPKAAPATTQETKSGLGYAQDARVLRILGGN